MFDEMNSMVELPVFDGEKKNFVSWWIRFQAYSRVIGFNSALRKSVELPISEKETKKLSAAVVSEKKIILAVKRNELAVTHVMKAMGNDAVRNKLKTIVNSGWPGGLAYEIIEKLNEEYSPVQKTVSAEKKNPKNVIRVSQG